MTKEIVYIDGDWVEKAQAKVSVFDRGFLFADGVYEVIPVINGKAIDFAPFVERLTYSLRELSLIQALDLLASEGGDAENQLKHLVNSAIELNNIDEGGVYLQITRGVAERDFAFPEGVKPTIMVFGFHKSIINNALVQTGVKVVSTTDLRWKRRDIKSISLLAQCLSKQAAVEQDAFEAWLVEDGYITEGASSTAYIVKDGVIITRPLSNSILSGIRRKMLVEIAKQQALQFEQRLFTLQEALEADEAFISSATALILPVVNIDGKQIGNGLVGHVAKLARKLYLENAMTQVN